MQAALEVLSAAPDGLYDMASSFWAYFEAR